MPTIRIPTPLRAYAAGRARVQVSGSTAGQALQDLIRQYPALRPHLFSADDQPRAFVNLFLDGNNLRDLQGMDTRLQDDDVLLLIPSIAGGRI